MRQEGFEILYEKYPRLVPEGTYFEHRSGWVGILDRYFAEVEANLPADVPWSIRQIKEKFGTLRLYCEPLWPNTKPTAIFEVAIINQGLAVTPAPDKNPINEALLFAKMRAEARSGYICEHCGQPGSMRNKGGYFFTACDEHGDGLESLKGNGSAYMYGGRVFRYDPVVDDLVDTP